MIEAKGRAMSTPERVLDEAYRYHLASMRRDTAEDIAAYIANHGVTFSEVIEWGGGCALEIRHGGQVAVRYTVTVEASREYALGVRREMYLHFLRYLIARGALPLVMRFA